MDLQESSQDKKRNRLMDNQEATLKLMKNFIRETRAFRDLVSNFMRESREKKCCGCHCVTERAKVSPKPYSGRLTTILTGDLRDCAFEDFGDGAVGDFEDCMVENFGDGAEGDFRDGIGNDAIASGSSNSVGDSGEDRDGFLQKAVKIKSGSSNVGNFARKLVKTIFQPRETGWAKLFRDRGENVIGSREAGYD